MNTTLNRDKLLKAVKRQGHFTSADLRDIVEYGVDGGFTGFVYTTECVDFFDRHVEEIWDLLHETAAEHGVDPFELIAGFRRLDMANSWNGFKNLLTWFAVEEMARMACERQRRAPCAMRRE